MNADQEGTNEVVVERIFTLQADHPAVKLYQSLLPNGDPKRKRLKFFTNKMGFTTATVEVLGETRFVSADIKDLEPSQVPGLNLVSYRDACKLQNYLSQ